MRVRGIDGYSIIHDLLIGEEGRVVDYIGFALGYRVRAMRFFHIWGNLDLSPRRRGYYDALHRAYELLIEHGMYPWGVRYCDQEPGMSVCLSAAERADYETHNRSVLASFPMIEELMNEAWQNGNFAGTLTPVSTFCTRSAAPDDRLPDDAGPLLHFTTHHTPRGNEQTRKAKEMIDVAKLGFDHWSPSGMCAAAGEPPHINKDEWTDPQRCADYYALCDLFGNGGVIHGGFGPDGSNAPLQSCIVPTDPNTLACLDAIAEVWREGNDVPLGTFAEGKYLRGTADNTGDLGIDHFDRYTEHGENPKGALRSFAMQVGPRQVIVPVDRGAQWARTLRNGYRLVEARGYRENVVIVER